MTYRPLVTALLASLLTLACGDEGSPGKDRQSGEAQAKLEPKFYPFSLDDLEKLRVPVTDLDASSPDRARMNEKQVVAFFTERAPGNTCTWGGFARARGGGDSCTPMRMSCELPHPFTVHELNLNLQLEVRRDSCSSPFLLRRVRLRAAGETGKQLVDLLRDRFGAPQFVNLEPHWAEHRWINIGQGLPEIVVMELGPQ